MLNIEIIEEKDNNLKIKTWMEPRFLASEPVITHLSTKIKEEVIKKIKKDYKNSEIFFESKVQKLTNLNENSRTWQVLEVKLIKKSKPTKKKANQKVKSEGSSSGDSKSRSKS